MKSPLEKKIEFKETAVKEALPEVQPLPKTKKNWSLKLPRLPKFNHQKVLFFMAIFISLVILGVVFGLLPSLRIKNGLLQLRQTLKAVAEETQNRNLTQAAEKLKETRTHLDRLEGDYRKLIWLKVIPFIGGFYRDGERLLSSGHYLLGSADVALEALAPYADILGMDEGEGEIKKMEEMTAEERLVLALDTLDKLQPSLDQIGEKLDKAQEEVDQIDPKRYPETLFGQKIRENVVSVINLVDSSDRMVNEIKPIISYLGPLLGVPDEKKYLLLFQNDAELRPTGGFLTAYAVLSVKNGKFTALGSYDIYNLDAQLGNRVKAPEPILNYHKNVFYWHLRDMNLSPDFKVSMETFLENYQKVASLKDIDAVIALDVHFLVDLLEILGTVGVGGDWGEFSAEIDPRCDCPQVFYMLEWYADKPSIGPRAGRKAVLGPLMQSIVLNAMGSPRKKWPEFFNVALTNIQEKHILFYFFDEEIQAAIEALNAGGRIKEYEGDYFHLNDCNFAGAKSNMFIREDVFQEIEIGSDGSVVKTVTIDYKNPAPASNCNLEAGELCLNGLYRDWVRLYVPKGSELLESSGSETEVKTYEDLGKTVFEAFYGDKSPLRPQGKAQVQFKYQLPFKVNKGEPYPLLIQKQPGTYGYEYTISLNGKEEILELKTDRELKL